jgi:hypothetical protein
MLCKKNSSEACWCRSNSQNCMRKGLSSGNRRVLASSGTDATDRQ